MQSARLRAALSCLAISGLLATGCGGGEAKGKETPTPQLTTAGSSPPPTFTAEHVKRALITPPEVGKDMRPLRVALQALREGAAPMCSLSTAKVPGRPQITTRQFANPRDRTHEPKYGQFIAHYDDPQGAAKAYEVLVGRAKACPKKRHVPPKKLPGNFILFEHDDTWSTTEDSLEGWTHLRGLEKHVEPPSATKRNVFHFIYDYALRGNVLVSTLYWERRDPKQSGAPIASQATRILIAQLRKIG